MKVEFFPNGNSTFIRKTTDNGSVISYSISTYYNVLETDKSKIVSDGLDTATITAKIYNYLDEFQSNWKGDITFNFEGQEQVVSTTNGGASIPFSSSIKGDFTIKTDDSEVRVVAE